MSFSGSFAVVGAYEHPTRWAPDKTELQIIGESARGALEDAGLTLADVDGLFSTSMGTSSAGKASLQSTITSPVSVFTMSATENAPSRSAGASSTSVTPAFSIFSNATRVMRLPAAPTGHSHQAHPAQRCPG